MDTALVITIVVVLVLIAAAAVFAVPWQRSRRLRSRFGPEYERAVREHGDRRAAERELAERERRHSELRLQPLSDDARRRFETEWDSVQERFVDSPESAVRDAHELLDRLMIERGYPAGDDDRRIADLSVEHAGTVGRYREARAASERSTGGDASTEDLRSAMVHFRALFHELLDGGSAASAASDAADPGDPAAR
ncbi:hypothetical protein [Streptomonospora wellingtoniae]|uniref:Secreted protein n=1 Tax=Streptomonospora wellingtoniae TaxID=3075544 RepID=A0ABU2KN90_9ACTN|nr:hypothetical protein [Streptomonospora sp. DSM 45055]MDT0300737.1 hypothetical protein [Streptomonospora sp. DSM 45055]